MHFVVTDFFAIHIVVKSSIILRIVCNALHLCLHSPRMDPAFCIFCKLSGKFFCFFESFRGIKDCRLVHIVPEAFNSLLNKETIFVSEPFSGIFIQHIREMGISRPYGCNEITSVFSLTEIVVLDTFFVNIVSRLNLDTGIDDRDQSKILVFHFLYEFRKILEVFFAQCEVLERLHVIDIHVDHIDRDVILTISSGNGTEIFFCGVAPTALSETESKLRRDVAASDHMTELFYDIISIFAFDHIDIQVRIFAGYFESVHSGISDIECQF